MRYQLEHESRVVFAEPVREHHCELRLAPRATDEQSILALELLTTPESEVHSYVDCFGNTVHCFDVTPPHTEIGVRVRATVETRMENPFDFVPLPASQEKRWLEQYERRQPSVLDYVLHRSAFVPELTAADEFFADAPHYEEKEALFTVAIAARDWIAGRLAFEAAPPAKRLSLARVLELGVGDSSDLSHALVALVRSWGVPTRFVAGYQDAADEEPSRTPLHAWAEVLVPGAGWRGLDVANGLVVNDAYVAVAVGRDVDDTTPRKSVFKGEDTGTSRLVELLFARQEQ